MTCDRGNVNEIQLEIFNSILGAVVQLFRKVRLKSN